MICSICRSKIDYEITFDNLFKFKSDIWTFVVWVNKFSCGKLISETEYDAIPNYQVGFEIDGDAPEQTKDYTDKFYKDLKSFADTL